MKAFCTVKTQAEMNDAIVRREARIELGAKISVELRIPYGFVPIVKSIAGGLLKIFEGSVVARGSSSVVAWGSSSVVARESSSVVARGSSSVVARGSSSVVAWGSSRVEARESSSVEAWESSSVVARESSSVVAWGSSRVEARESSSVVARGSSSVVAWGSSRVEARESSSVEAWESSSVVARESSSVVATCTACLALHGALVVAKASAQVAVHLNDGAACDGGSQIVVKKPRTISEWVEWHGVQTIGGSAVLYKGLHADYRSSRGGVYTPGTKTVSDAWDNGAVECGCGLHFSPRPCMTKEFISDPKHFVACLVPLDKIAIHPDGNYPEKCKSPECWNWYECDIHGDVIGSKFDPPDTSKRKSARASTKKVKTRKA